MGERSDRPSPPIEIVTIGDELLRGDLVDTNGGWLAAELHALGLPVTWMSSIGDASGDIVGAFERAFERSQVVIASGGLGPTDDDRTLTSLAQAAGVELRRDEGAFRHIEAIFARAGLSFTPNNESQAWVPEGAAVLLNEQGTAPGVRLSLPGRRGGAGCHVFCLPGVPREMKWLYQRYIAPWLQEQLGLRPARRRTLKVFGIGESTVDHRLEGLLDDVDTSGCEVSVHYRATFPENHVTLLVRPPEGGGEGAEVLADALAEEAARRLDGHLFAREAAHSYGDALVAALRGAGATVALAESCTGGRAADLLTNATGSSEVFELGIVAYANRIKQRQLGVPEAVLVEYGAVSQACVEAMARGVRERAGATYGVAISGIAGPGGGSPDKPVGTVHFALDSADGTRHLHRVFPYDRDRNKLLAAYVALWLVLREVKGVEKGSATDPLDGRWRERR